MTIRNDLRTSFSKEESFTLEQAYTASSNQPHSIRARIYEAIDEGEIQRISQGVYQFVDKDSSALFIKGNGRDLSAFADGSIDAIITDHPYEDSVSHKGGNRSFADYETFRYTEDDFVQKARVLKDGAFMVEFVAEENASNLDYIYAMKKMAQKAGFDYYATVAWKKGSFVANTGRKSKNTEQMIFFTKGKARALRPNAKNGSTMSGTTAMLPTVFDVQPPSRKERVHQAEKPVELLVQLLELISLPGEVILDTFAGSANLIEAGWRTNRHIIAIEKDESTFVSSLVRLVA